MITLTEFQDRQVEMFAACLNFRLPRLWKGERTKYLAASVPLFGGGDDLRPGRTVSHDSCLRLCLVGYAGFGPEFLNLKIVRSSRRQGK